MPTIESTPIFVTYTPDPLAVARARMEQATARQLLAVLTAIQMGHVLPVFAACDVVRETMARKEAA